MTKSIRVLLLSSASVAVIGMTTSSAVAGDLIHPTYSDEIALPGLTAVLSFWAGGGYPSVTPPDGSFDAPYLGFGGSAKAGANNWMVELNAHANSATSTTSTTGAGYATFAGHYLWRNDRSISGFMLGAGHAGHESEDSSSQHLFGAFEHLGYLSPKATYFFQAGAHGAVIGDTSSTQGLGVFGRIGFRHYMGQDARIEGDVRIGYARYDGNTWGPDAAWGLSYQRRIGNSPWTAEIFYKGAWVGDYDHGGASGTAIDTQLGLRASVDVGNATIYQRDMALPFDTPDFSRGWGWTNELN